MLVQIGEPSAAVTLACVMRDLDDGQGPQYLPVKDVGALADGERAFVGRFRILQERHGPSGSHVRNVCIPVDARSLEETKAALVRRCVPKPAPMTVCVMRDFGDGTGMQFVPMVDAVNVQQNERAFVGVFNARREGGYGPSGSHERIVAFPVSTPRETTVGELCLCDADKM